MKFVVTMAVREMRASWRRLLFFFVCLSIGVGAIVAIRSVIQSVRVVFAREARSLITADAIITSNQAFPQDLVAKIDERLKQADASSIRSIELATMARAADREGPARIVELRAVEQGFPYYGQMKLANGQPFDHSLLQNFGVLARPELLAQLGLSVGEGLMIGTHRFTIRGVIEAEPGRRLGAFSLGPRVFVDLADLQKSGLMAFGSRATHQRLVKVSEAGLGRLVSNLRRDFASTYARVRSYKAMEDDIGEDFQRAENYLSLVGLVIVILGGIGVSSVTRVFVQQKIRSIAILKCLGGRSLQLLTIYMAQVIVLGLAGTAFGVLLAGLAIRAIPATMAAAAASAGLDISYSLTVPAVLQGLGIGLLVSILFSLLPLLEIRHVKPSLLLRSESVKRSVDLVQLIVLVVVASGLVGLTIWQAGSLRIGLVVAVGFAGAALVLHLAGIGLIRAIAPLAQTRWFPLRHAVLQLSRPGSQARIVLLAVGLGSFFIVGVRSLQENLIREFTVNISPEAPDMFLLDIQRDQVSRMQQFLASWQDQGAAPPQLIPVLRARVNGVEGRELSLDNYEDVRGRGSLGREYTITYRPALERNESIIAGTFWDDKTAAAQGPGGTPPEGEVSIEESLQERFRINIGDKMRFDVMGRTVTARVTSVRKVEWSDSRAGGFMFVFRPGLFDEAPHGFISFFRGPAELERRARMQGEMVTRFPNVSVIDGREMLAAIRTVIDNVTLAVTVVGTLVVLSGLLILIGAVAMTKFRRIYEAAIFKTLGATRRTIASVLLLEYGVLGALAGTIGSVGAIALTWGISRFALDIPWRALPLISATGIAVTALLVAVVGVAASWEVLQRKPLATLRAE